MAQPAGLFGSGTVFGTGREWSRDLAIAASVGLFLGLVGPFGSYSNTSHVTVLAYWIGSLLFGAVLFGLTLRPAAHLAPKRRVPAAAILSVTLIAVAIPLALGCHAVALRLWPRPIGEIGWSMWYAQTLVISLPLALCYWLGSVGRPKPRQPDSAPAMATTHDFLLRLPPRLGKNLLALEMEDHYVRAHTAAGSALILIPLHRAIAELAPTHGIQTHRSWWVARDAVTGIIRDGRNLRLQLTNGLQAPVARTKIASLREAGLLRDGA
jgi:hypothetical protein